MKTKKSLILTSNQNNMKQLFLIIAFLLGITGIKAQTNPFEELGYTPRFATLSNGQFNEFHDNDTIVQIGSVWLNTKSKQIVGFVEQDTLYSEATLRPDIVSRWISPDPLADHPNQVDKSPYAAMWNNPVYWDDPDGRCPWCLGAIIGAAVDYGLQVAVNFAEGKSGLEAFTDVDGGSILVSAGAGALSGGLSVASKVKTGSKLVKIASSEVGESVIDATASVTNQLVKDGKVDLTNTAIDVTVGKVVGKKVGEITENAAKQSPKGKVLSRQLDRAERVAGSNPRPSRAQKVEQAKKAQAVHTANRTTATTVSSTGVASEAVKQTKSVITDDENKR